MKSQLHQACIFLLTEKIASLEKTIQDAQKAASEDTKSSAGDKFETSREMIKMEINKNSAQLSKALEMLGYLKQLNPDKKNTKVGFGSLVTTNEGNYYFSVSLGKVVSEEQTYFALSMGSPIGKALLDKKTGDEVGFQGRKVKVVEIV